jgi:hypothetical protein
MKKILNVIFIILFIVSLLSFGSLTITRDVLNNETSTTKKSELTTGVGATYDIKGEDKLVTYAEIENIDSVNPEIAHRYLDADLTKQNIPTDALEYVLAEDDYQGMYYDYRAKAIGYLLDENEKPQLEIDRILGMVDRGLTKYNTEKGTNLPVEKIKNETNTVAQGIDTKIEKLKENEIVKSGLKAAKSNTLYYGSIALLIISAIALLAINGIVKGIQKIGIALILSGILSIIISIGINSNIFNKIKEVAGTIIKYISNKSMTFGIIYIVVGIVLIVISTMITANTNKKIRQKEYAKVKVSKEEKETKEEEEIKEEQPEEKIEEEKPKEIKKNTKKKSNK